MGGRRVGDRRVGPEGCCPKLRKGGAPKGEGPKISRFFFPLPPLFIFLSSSWFCGILVVLLTGTLKCPIPSPSEETVFGQSIFGQSIFGQN